MEERSFDQKTLVGIISGFGEKAKKYIIGSVILLPLILIIGTLGYSYYSIEDTKSHMQEVLKEYENSRHDILTATITESYKQAKLQTEYIKRDIVQQLDIAYQGNIETMRSDYWSKDSDTPFYQILSNNISYKYINKDTDGNRVFIANRKGILMDNSITYLENSFTTWEEYLNDTKKNKFLVEAVEQINSKDHNMILWFDDITALDALEDTNDMHSISSFISNKIGENKMYDLEKFSVLTVSYVFDHKDIFGVPDVVAGKFMNNDKLYIIQVFNIKDMIESNKDLQSSLTKYEALVENTQLRYNKVIQYKTLATILLMVLEVVLFFGVWYLAEFYLYSRSIVNKMCKLRED